MVPTITNTALIFNFPSLHATPLSFPISAFCRNKVHLTFSTRIHYRDVLPSKGKYPISCICVYTKIPMHILHLVEIHLVCNSKMMAKILSSIVQDSEFRKCSDRFDIHNILSCDDRTRVIQRQDL